MTETLPLLSEAQLTEYQELGYTRVPAVFPIDELAAIDAEIDRLEWKQLEENGRDDGWLLRLGLRSEIMQRMVADERLLNLVESIVRPGIAIYSAKLVPKLPHDYRVCHWHQDDAYYSVQADSNTRMSIWLPLQDSDVDNGCLHVIPGSHRWGLQEWRQRDEGYCNRALIPPEDFDFTQAVAVPAEAGDVILFSALLWHSSPSNSTDRIRRAFIVSYQEATVPGGNADQWKVLRPASGSDDFGNEVERNWSQAQWRPIWEARSP
ncbi:MAG: phytanoyl-CoA dioxygenase family protein [Candidatus Latescibacterota bacterium]|nr:phytanoyl-CoA dioxygenase family protein [Candidatus Latescibacterota bacterium]